MPEPGSEALTRPSAMGWRQAPPGALASTGGAGITSPSARLVNSRPVVSRSSRINSWSLLS